MEWIRVEAADPLAPSLGLDPRHADGTLYIDEHEGVALDKTEIDALYDASQELERLCLDAVAHAIEKNDLARFGLSDVAARLVADSWQRQARNLIGRFDLAYVPGSPPKLLEYNADTPVVLVEAASYQAAWKDRHFPDAMQWNEIEARLVEAWRQMGLARLPIHFAGSGDDADAALTLDFLAQSARAAGFEANRLDLDAIGWDGEKFLDRDNRPIRTLCKLYPWQWLVEDDFGAHLADAEMTTIEPAWKMLLDDKRLLVLLWERFEGHPLLLPASLESGDIAGAGVAKPALGRNGAGVRLFANGLDAAQTGGDREPVDPRDGPIVFQALSPLATLGEAKLLASTWMVASQPAGLGLRAEAGALVGSAARFVPHIVR
jgi:glutathionylspermidine synthase